VAATSRAYKHRLFCVVWDIVNLARSGQIWFSLYARGDVRTTKELSRESVYQQSLVDEKCTPSNSGRKIDTNSIIACIAGFGSVLH
jgi:hypothetical protein